MRSHFTGRLFRSRQKRPKLTRSFSRQRRRDRSPALHVLPDVLRLRQPRLRPADPPQDAQLEAEVQVLPLVSEQFVLITLSISERFMACIESSMTIWTTGI